MNPTKPQNYLGQKFNRLTVISDTIRENNRSYFMVRCECGKEYKASVYHIKTGEMKSCGCLQKDRRNEFFKERYLGKRFTMLTVIKQMPSKNNFSMWLCKCDCGNETIVSGNSLSKKNTQSCGCLSGVQHRMTNTPEYNSWQAMIERCRNKNTVRYDRYGGRGIIVCERWLESFLNFYEDMGSKPSPKHSVGRINNDGNYEPSNCEWQTQDIQMKSMSRNVFLMYNGEKLIQSDFARKFGVRQHTVSKYIKNHSVEEAIEYYSSKYSNVVT